MYYYRSDAEPTPFKLYIIIIALVLALLLVFLHRYIESSIRPLRKLKEGIEKFAIGDKTLDIDTSGKDEVALVAKSFVKAVNEIEALERGRTLFLRNIMHELKTPLTRGKLISFMMKDEISEKEKLENIFNQMEMHLKDLVNIESLNSQKLQLDKKSYAAIDLVENALDKLDIQSEQISVNINVNTVEVDFELFSLAIKNLIDNARKYATTYPIEVLWDSEKFEVSNTGQALEKPIEAYFEAYTRDQSHTALEGMGLGLYITKEILEKHGCTLHYYYENGKHHFGIKQKCVMKQLI
jgi:two-component system OmpR family sensor kinase